MTMTMTALRREYLILYNSNGPYDLCKIINLEQNTEVLIGRFSYDLPLNTNYIYRVLDFSCFSGQS